MTARKPIPKEIRLKVYDKYHGHCAYCGKEIKYKDMQVDHAEPFAKAIYGYKNEREKANQMIMDGSIDSIDNLMPACRACNFYKGGGDIEQFRNRIKNKLDHTCRSTFQTRLAMQFGMITYKPWDGKFYYESQGNFIDDMPFSMKWLKDNIDMEAVEKDGHVQVYFEDIVFDENGEAGHCDIIYCGQVFWTCGKGTIGEKWLCSCSNEWRGDDWIPSIRTIADFKRLWRVATGFDLPLKR